MYTNPTVADFKAYFTRDWPYGNDNKSVMDVDITKAIAQAGFNFNQALFSTQDRYTMGFLYLTAHYLVVDLRMAAQGISGSYPWLQTSHAAGSVSESLQIPQRILDNPVFAMLSKTNYGAKYLALILPQLVGNVFTVRGRTHA